MNDMKLLLGGIVLVGGAAIAANLIYDAIYSGHYELAKSAIDGVSNIAKESTKYNTDKMMIAGSAEALKFGVDVLNQRRIERQRRWL